MDSEPPRDYRIVERDGKLVVERDGEKQPAGAPTGRSLALPKLSIREKGIELFLGRFDAQLTAEGDAIVSASQLADYEKLLKLDARSYDEFYLTPAQQAVLGWWSMGMLALIPALIVAVILFNLLDLPAVVGFALLGGAAYGATRWIEQQLGPIREQHYVPAESAES